MKKQAQKPRYVTVPNPEFNRAMAEIGRSSKASPHRNKARYTRKSKYGKKDW